MQRLLTARRWPGNIRELENTVLGALVFARTELIRPEDVLAEPPPFGLDGDESYEEGTLKAQRWIVQNALAKTDGNVTAAAELLKMDRKNLHRVIKKLLYEA